MTRRRPTTARLASFALVPAVAMLAAVLVTFAPAPAAASGGTASGGTGSSSTGSSSTVTALDTGTPAAATPTPSASATASPTATPTPPPSTPPSKPPTTSPKPKPPPQPARPHPHKAPALPKRQHPKRKQWPVSVDLRTVPALAGVRFSVDGHIYATGTDGTAVVTMQHDFAAHTLAVLTPTFATANRRYSFARWSGQRDPNQTYRTVVTGLPWRAGYAITAAFTQQCPVSPAFTDQHGTRLDPAILTSATLKSDAGQLSALPLRGTTWLECTTAIYSGGVLATRPIAYRLQSLIAAGTNIVDAGRQSFNPTANPNPTFAGYFYDLTVTAHDAFFGGTSGNAATVTGADGARHQAVFSPSHTALFKHLPRGDYTIGVTGGGIGLSKGLRLSRDSSADLNVVSVGDLGAGAGGGGAFAVVLPLLARYRRGRSPRMAHSQEVLAE